MELCIFEKYFEKTWRFLCFSVREKEKVTSTPARTYLQTNLLLTTSPPPQSRRRRPPLLPLTLRFLDAMSVFSGGIWRQKWRMRIQCFLISSPGKKRKQNTRTRVHIWLEEWYVENREILRKQKEKKDKTKNKTKFKDGPDNNAVVLEIEATDFYPPS